MKFAKYLESEAVPEWQAAYIDYKGLKKLIKKATAQMCDNTYLTPINIESHTNYQGIVNDMHLIPGSSSGRAYSENILNHEASARRNSSYININIPSSSSSSMPPRNHDPNLLRSQGPLIKSITDIRRNHPVTIFNREVDIGIPSLQNLETPHPPKQELVSLRSKSSYNSSENLERIFEHKEGVENRDNNMSKNNDRDRDTGKDSDSIDADSGVGVGVDQYLAPSIPLEKTKKKFSMINRIGDMPIISQIRKGSAALYNKHQNSLAYSKNGRKLTNKSLPTGVTKSLYRYNGSEIVRRKGSTRYQSEMIETSYAAADQFKKALKYRFPGEQAFFCYCDEQLEKINIFFEQKEKSFLERLDKFLPQQEILVQMEEANKSPDNPEFRKEKRFGLLKSFNLSKKTKDVYINADTEVTLKITLERAKLRMKKAIKEIYRAMEMLKSYQALNKTGFVKIMKKYTKATHWESGPSFYLETVDKSYFAKSDKINRAIAQIENLFAQYYTDQSLQAAKQELRIPIDIHKVQSSSVFKSGVAIGAALPIIVHASYYVSKKPDWNNKTILLQIYSCQILALLFLTLFSTNMLSWYTSNINYKFIFMFDPRDNLSPWQFFKVSSTLLLISLIVLGINIEVTSSIINNYLGIMLFGFNLLVLFLPFDTLYLSARRWLIHSLKRLLLPGLYPVEFRDFFLADCLCSLGYSLTLFYLVGCGSANKWNEIGDAKCLPTTSLIGTFLICSPSLVRFIQCIRRYVDSSEAFPHLLNALKYAASILAIWVLYLHNTKGTDFLRWCSIFVMAISSLYSTFWDLFMDWGFFESEAEHPLLRKQLKFNFIPVYYFAMVTDPILRFSWVLNYLYPIGISNFVISRPLFRFMLALLEVLRRYQWCFFRLENEHVNNCGQFRATIDIPLPFFVHSRPIDDLIDSDN